MEIFTEKQIIKYVLYRILLLSLEYVLAEKWIAETSVEMPAVFLSRLFVRTLLENVRAFHVTQ